MCKFQNFHSPVKKKKKKKKKKTMKFEKTYFGMKKRTAVFSFEKRTKYGKNVLVGSSGGGGGEDDFFNLDLMFWLIKIICFRANWPQCKVHVSDEHCFYVRMLFKTRQNPVFIVAWDKYIMLHHYLNSKALLYYKMSNKNENCILTRSTRGILKQ